MALKLHPAHYGHVGFWLREEMVEPYAISVTDLAAHLRVTRQALSALLNGRASLSAEMALRFEQAFGVSADTLLRMQTAYDLAQARLQEKDLAVARLQLAA